ncbi:hypothetical protein [Enterobacter asburiae]|nr:hypothetical protein [Salmonella enterica]EJG8857834.1 hypothetical protein [Salmonella enterica]
MEILNEILILCKTAALVISLYSSCIYTEGIRRELIKKWLKRKSVYIERVMGSGGKIEEYSIREDWFNLKEYVRFIIATITIMMLITFAAISMGVNDGLGILLMIHLSIITSLIIKRTRKQQRINARGIRSKEAFNGISVYNL